MIVVEAMVRIGNVALVNVNVDDETGEIMDMAIWRIDPEDVLSHELVAYTSHDPETLEFTSQFEKELAKAILDAKERNEKLQIKESL